jgi:hypothetical protein
MWVGQILDHVNASIVEQLHASIVVLGGIDGINSNGVHAQLLDERNISLAASFIRKRVDVRLWLSSSSSTATGGDVILLICDTLDEELGTILVKEVGALEWFTVSLSFLRVH